MSELSEELRAAAQVIRRTRSCVAPHAGCRCAEADALADALEVEALRGEQSGPVDAELLESARRINHFGGVL